METEGNPTFFVFNDGQHRISASVNYMLLQDGDTNEVKLQAAHGDVELFFCVYGRVGDCPVFLFYGIVGGCPTYFFNQ